jgi:hypothetical protein
LPSIPFALLLIRPKKYNLLTNCHDLYIFRDITPDTKIVKEIPMQQPSGKTVPDHET